MVSGGAIPTTPRPAQTPRSPGRKASIANAQLPLLEKRRSEPVPDVRLKRDSRQKMDWSDGNASRSAQPCRSPPELIPARRRHSVFPALGFNSQFSVDEDCGSQFQKEQDLKQGRPKTEKHRRRSKRRRYRFCKALSVEAKTALMLTYDDLIVRKMSQIDLDPNSGISKAKSYESPAHSDTEDDLTTVTIQRAMDILDCLKEKTGEHVTSTRHRERVWDPVVQLQSWRNKVNGQTPLHWTKALAQS